MKLRAIFTESFLDGFTLAGFMTRLRRPGEVTRLLEPPVERVGWTPWVFEMGAGENAEVAVSGDLHKVPEPALRKMMAMLEGENKQRKTQAPNPA